MKQIYLTEVDYLIRGPIKDWTNNVSIDVADLHFSVTAFPNPFEEKVTLKLNLEQRNEVAIQLFSLDGRVHVTCTPGGTLRKPAVPLQARALLYLPLMSPCS